MELLFPHDSDGYALRVSAKVTTEEYDRYQPIDEQMDFHEKLRLLYVAATRARDHLVISVHRPDRVPPDERSTWTHAELLWAAAEGAPHWHRLHRRRARRARSVASARRGRCAPRLARVVGGTRPRARGRIGVARALGHRDRE